MDAESSRKEAKDDDVEGASPDRGREDDVVGVDEEKMEGALLSKGDSGEENGYPVLSTC